MAKKFALFWHNKFDQDVFLPIYVARTIITKPILVYGQVADLMVEALYFDTNTAKKVLLVWHNCSQ